MPWVWNRWVDLETIRLSVRHGTGVLGAVVVFSLVAAGVDWMLNPGWLKTLLRGVDGFVLLGLVAMLGKKLIKALNR